MVKVKRAKSKSPKFRKCQCVERPKRGYCNSVQQCPHIHFKTDVVDRDELGRNDHLNLLCTPKGYRWPPFTTPPGEEEEGEEEENAGFGERAIGKRLICHGQKVRKADRQYVHNFLAEVWALLTPEMVNRLKEMLQNEFNMTPEEASDFILEQKAKSIPVVEEPAKKVKGFVVRRGRKCAGIRHYYSTQFNRIMSAKVTDYLVATLSSRRTKNQRKISEFLLKNVNDVTGEKFTLQYPKTLAHKIMVFFTDRISGWLAERVSEAEELLREDREIEELKAQKNKHEKGKAKKQGRSLDKEGGNESKQTTDESNQSLRKEESKPKSNQSLRKEESKPKSNQSLRKEESLKSNPSLRKEESKIKSNQSLPKEEENPPEEPNPPPDDDVPKNPEN